MKNKVQLGCREANQIDLVDYLEKLGHLPKKIRGNDYWYLSPLRKENTASFKVNRTLNLWYDHGTGKGGSLIDFGIQYHHCTVRELLTKLKNDNDKVFLFQPQRLFRHEDTASLNLQISPIHIISSGPIKNNALLNYLQERKIPFDTANKYCVQVQFELYQKTRLAIGFKNSTGGYELRSPDFKGSSSPKASKLIVETGAEHLAVFEGFFSFLSYKTLEEKGLQKRLSLPNQQQDFLVLNSLAFLEKSRMKMESYQNIHLFLDRDKAGIAATQKALQWSIKYKDMSQFYRHHKDLNEFLVNDTNLTLQQRQGKRYRL